MKNRRRKIGARGTKDKHTIRDKRISNRGTGNKGHSRKNSNSISKHNKNIESNNRILNKLNPTGKANYLKITEYLAESSKYVNSEEFAGRGLLVEILGVEKRKKGLYGPGFTIKLLDCKSNKERIWNTKSITALRAIQNIMRQGFSRIQIWKTGRGQDARYCAKGVEAAVQKAKVSTKLLQKKRRNAKR